MNASIPRQKRTAKMQPYIFIYIDWSLNYRRGKIVIKWRKSPALYFPRFLILSISTTFRPRFRQRRRRRRPRVVDRAPDRLQWRLKSISTRCSSARATGTYGTPIYWAQSRLISPVNLSFLTFCFCLVFDECLWTLIYNLNVVFCFVLFADCCLSLWWWVCWDFVEFLVCFLCFFNVENVWWLVFIIVMLVQVWIENFAQV